MNSQFEKLVFNDLQTFSQETLKRISANKVVEVSLIALENNSSADNVTYVLNCWARKLIDIYYLSEITVANIQRLFYVFGDRTAKILDSIKRKAFTEDSIDVLISLLLNWRDIISHVDIRAAQLARATILIESSIKVLTNYYSLLQSSKKSLLNGYALLFSESQNFQKLILSLMLDNFNVFLCKESSEVDDIIKIINGVSTVGEIVPLLDVKLTAEIWKFFSKLCSENSTFMKHSIEEDCTAFWLERPVKFLCEEIKNSISAIYEQDSDQSLDKLKRILKINSFYLKLLIKFASDFEHNYFAGSAHIVKSGIYTLTNSEKLAGTKVENLIKQYLTVGFMNLFNLIYKNKEFAQALYEETFSSGNEFEALHIILTEVFKNLIVEEDVEVLNLYLSIENNFVDKIFKNVPKYPGVFLKRENYETLITVISALWISKYNYSTVVQCSENLLTDGILQNNILLANICIDIWLILSRFINSKARYGYFLFWADICIKFPLFSSEPRTIYVQNLLKSIYDILPHSCKEEVWNDLLKSEEKKEKIILTLGIDRIPDEKKRDVFKAERVKRLQCLLERRFNGFTREDYYEMITNIKLLKSTSLSSNAPFQDLLINLLTNLLQKHETNKSHSLLINSLIEFLATHIELFPNQLEWLINILCLNISTDTAVKLRLIKLLSSFIETNEAQQKLYDILQKDPNKLIEIYLNYNCNKFQSNSLMDDLTTDAQIIYFFNKMPTYDFVHKCKFLKNEEFENIKRVKLDKENPLLKNMLQNAYTALNTFKEVTPTDSDIKLTTEIVKICEQILNARNK